MIYRFGCVAMAFVLASSASAQDAQQIQRLFDKAADQMRQRGYAATSPMSEGTLSASGKERIKLHVAGSGLTQIMGLCDTNCSDIDLALYDGSGNLIDKDVLTDDVPIVTWRGGAADLTVEVMMMKCKVSSCHYGVQSFVKSAAASASPSGIDVSDLASRNLRVLHIGDEVRGTLTPASVERSDGTYMDGYFYDAAAGEQITATLRSADFDSWLIIDQPHGPLRKWDDDSGGGHDSRLTITFPQAGRYIIAANTVAKHSTGNYTLTITRP